MHSISLATLGKFGGPAKAKFSTAHPVKHEHVDHKFPKVEVSNITSEEVNIKINVISEDDHDNQN